MADYTLTYDEGVKGWTSFHSFIPEGMIKLRNKLYSFKDGQLYEHNVASVPRNTFYGQYSNSKVSLFINQSPSENKVIKAVSQEGTGPWDTVLRAYESDQDEYKQTAIDDALYQEKEGVWYSHVRRAEAGNNLDGDKAYYGIGNVESVVGNVITVVGLTASSTISIGDNVYKEGGISLGTISATGTGTITIIADLSALSPGDFIYGKKDSRIDGSPLRGYVIEVELQNDKTIKQELFAIGAEIMKSFK